MQVLTATMENVGILIPNKDVDEMSQWNALDLDVCKFLREDTTKKHAHPK